MDTFQAYYADIHDPGWQSRIAAQLRERGMVTFSGITGHEALVAVARRLMTVRPHRDAGLDGVTVITGGPAAEWLAWEDAAISMESNGNPGQYSVQLDDVQVAFVRICSRYFATAASSTTAC